MTMRLLAASLLTACAPPPDEEVVALAKFPVTQIAVSIPASHMLRVRLDYPSPYDTCLVLDDDVVATAGGEQLAIDRGAFMSRFDGYPDCISPSASLEHLPQISPATFEIRDATRTITCALDAAFVARTATLDGPWVASPGQILTVRWSSAQELESHEMSVRFGVVDATEVSYPGGDLLSFKVPQIPPGTYRLEIVRAGAFYRSIDCGGIRNMLTEPLDLKTFQVEIEIR